VNEEKPTKRGKYILRDKEECGRRGEEKIVKL
jgi:hypothetical protein